MTQEQYEIIIKCIKQGVPVIADKLVNAFNKIVDNSNKYIERQQESKAMEAVEDKKEN